MEILYRLDPRTVLAERKRARGVNLEQKFLLDQALSDAPVQTFAQVRIVPDGNTQTQMILAAEEWSFNCVLRNRLAIAIVDPSRKLVRRFDMLSPEGNDAYNPFYEAEDDLGECYTASILT